MSIVMTRSTVAVTVCLSNSDGDLVVAIGRDDVYLANAREIIDAINKAAAETTVKWTLMIETHPAGCRVEKVIVTAGANYRVSDRNRMRLAAAILTQLRDAGCDLIVTEASSS